MIRNISISLILLFLQISVYAQYNEYYLRIYINDRSELETLTRMVSIDNVSGNEVIAYANAYQLEKLTHSQFHFEELEHPSLQSGRAITMATSVEQMANWDRYPTYSVYNQLMFKFSTDYPDLCKLDTIGTSIQNRNMLVLNITSDINTPKPKPEVLFSSTMHGDEVTGWILCMRLAHYLLSNYGTDTRITNMLDSISIFIAPNTNPDGTYYNNNDNSVANARRSNANNYDLNRNFPDPWVNPNYDGTNPGGTYQKETMIMMDYAGTRHFILGINYHGGAEVANYPWDGYTSNQRKHPDNNWFIQICRQYATSAQTYGPSNYFRELNNGITEGGDWYVIHGGRQDYMNYWHNCKEITLEVSTTKMPQSENLPNYWNYNREAMLSYIENVKYGIRGIVTNEDGEPVSAKVTVVGHDNYNSHAVTNSEFGNYYRMIEPGTFSLLFESFGYESQTLTGILSQQNKTTIVDVTLQKAPTYSITGVLVNSTTGIPIENVTIEVKDTPVPSATTDESGNFTLAIPGGTYQFVFTKEGFIKKELTVDISRNTDLLVVSFEPFTGFDFEDGAPEGFTFSGNQPWNITTTSAYYGTKSMRSGNIGNSQTSTMSYTFNTENAGKVIFYSKVSSEAQYDLLRFYIDGSLKDTWSGEVDWIEHAYDVSAGNHTLQWTYSKDISAIGGSDCAWVDYISLPKNTQNAVPYINPRSIAFETEETSGETKISMWNVGNANMNFYATIENEQSNSWLSLENSAGTLAANQQNNFILSYNFSSFPNGTYETNMLIDIGDSIMSIPVSITFMRNDGEEYGIPYVTPKSIDIETEETTGDCVVTMKNIGNKAFNYNLSIAPEESVAWLSLSHNFGVLEAGEETEIVLSYDISPFTKELFAANLIIDVTDSIITIPVKINYNVGISVSEAKNFSFYPNPATNDITIMIPGFSNRANMEIYAITGQKIYSCEILEEKQTFTLSKSGIQKSGIYFIRIMSNDFVETVKLVVEY